MSGFANALITGQYSPRPPGPLGRDDESRFWASFGTTGIDPIGQFPDLLFGKSSPVQGHGSDLARLRIEKRALTPQ